MVVHVHVHIHMCAFNIDIALCFLFVVFLLSGFILGARVHLYPPTDVVKACFFASFNIIKGNVAVYKGLLLSDNNYRNTFPSI